MDLVPDRSTATPSPVVYAGPPRTLFVHSSFRTSSTWLWSKLRAASTTIAYYEIFNEFLADVDIGNIRRDDSACSSRHPAAAPYFLEFLPLLGSPRGVDNYHLDMAYTNFIPADGIDGHLTIEEKRYLDSLIAHAERQHRMPVLTSVRSMGRVKAVRKAFPLVNVFLHRNLFHQWASYTSMALAGDAYFLHSVTHILSKSRHDPVLGILYDWFGDRTRADDEQLFQAFLLLHLYLYAHAYDASDIIVDVTALAEDSRMRRDVEQKLSNVVSDHIDLSDARFEFGQSLVDCKAFPKFVDTVEQLMKLVAGSGVSHDAVEFIDGIKRDALNEWRRHELLTREARSVFIERLSAANADIETSRASLSAVAAERDLRTTQLAEADAARENLQASLAQAAAERDLRTTQLAEANAARESLEANLAQAVAERDLRTAQLAEANAARESLEANLAQAVAERRQAQVEASSRFPFGAWRRRRRA